MGDIDFKALGEGLLTSVETRFKSYLDQNQNVRSFLVDLGKRYAYLTAKLHTAADEDARAGVLRDLRRVENTFELELDAISESARGEIFKQLKAALGVVVSFAVQNLPAIIAAVRR